MTEDEFVYRVRNELIPDELELYRTVPLVEPPLQDVWPDPSWNTERGSRAFDLTLADGRILHLRSEDGRAFRLLSDDDIG